RRDERMTSAADRVIPFRWKRDGDGWRLFVERRQFGRLVPDKEHPGMWRCVMPNGRVSDLANLSWARRAVMESAARVLEWERRQLGATAPREGLAKGGFLGGPSPAVASIRKARCQRPAPAMRTPRR